MTLKQVGKLIEKAKYYPLFLIYFLSKLVPKNKKIWVLGTYNNGFSDNTKYLYLELEQNHKDICFIWICRKKESVKKLRSKNIDAFYKRSMKGIWYLLRASIHFTNTNLVDTSFWLSRGAIFVNLWHGVPLKQIEFDIKKGNNAFKFENTNLLEYFFKKISFPANYRKPDYILCTSDYMAQKLRSSFRVGNSNLLFSVYPRNNIFNYSKAELKKIIYRFESTKTYTILNKIEEASKTFIYLPTFRDGNTGFLEDSGINFQNYNSFLKKFNFLLLIKLHPNLVNDNEDLSNITFLDTAIDIYPFLKFTDHLITDYSSIFVDYLLLDKEIIFFPFDKNEYLNETRGIYENFDENTPGFKCYTFDELKNCMRNIDNKDFAKSRNKIKRKFWNRINNTSMTTFMDYFKFNL